MNALKFELSGKSAFFKKPEVNTYAYFTYNNIHKVALLGLLGAIIGLGGHNQQDKKYDTWPEFYEKLRNLKVSIIPKNYNGYFNKKIQTFTNTVGYYNRDSKNNPCTLVWKEQWIYNPKWVIYLLDDKSIERNVYEKLKYYLLNKNCEFMPYLGKNDHTANIINAEYVNMENVEFIDHIDSLFISENITFGKTTYDENVFFISEELMPTSLSNTNASYEYTLLKHTNITVNEFNSKALIYKHLSNILYFI